MIECALALCFWFGTVDVIEGNVMTVELTNDKGNFLSRTWSVSDFPCMQKEGTQFVFTTNGKPGNSKVWCAGSR